MSVQAAVLLGVVQGLTEFLPVSSSGHLAIAQHFLPGFDQPGVLFDIVLHLGTLVAVAIYFRREIGLLVSGLRPSGVGRAGRKLTMLLAIGTVPAIAAALAFGERIEASFERPAVVGIALCVTGILLLFSSRFGSEGRDLDDVSVGDAVLIGLFQSVALVPGISRSGSTIVAGLVRGLSNRAAARFSFLLSIPAILGAAVYNSGEMVHVPGEDVLAYVAGFLAAFVIGYLSIEIVIQLLTSRKFHWFGYYCLGIGGLVLVYVALGPA